MYIDCKSLANNIKEDVKGKIKNKEKPKLTIVQVGNNPASNSYVKGKIKDCEEVGIICNHVRYDENMTEEELIKEVKTLQETCSGIIVQLPLPKHINEANVTNAIDSAKDVDGFRKESLFIPCTPLGIMHILEHHTDLYGKDVLIINRSNIVGRPLVNLLLDKDATVTIAHSRTKNLFEKFKSADIIITAVGIPKFIKKEYINENQIIVDVAINRDENGKLCGDVEIGCEEIPASVTPVPGGVGLLTRAMLLYNTCLAHDSKMEE